MDYEEDCHDYYWFDDDHTVNEEWNDIKKTMERLVEKFGNSYDFE